MSTFRGVIKEIPKIRVDYFENAENDELFFLSHCHTDHMVGITNLAALEGAKLVVSRPTSSILENMYPELKPCLDILENNHEKSYTLADGTPILVTAVPAGHCPGSIMFYFQTEALNVLYTGDFRYRISDLSQLKVLQRIKEDLQAIYLDSTFLLPEFNYFPDQKESVKVVKKLVQEFLDESPINRVFLEIPARFGSEFLLLSLYKDLRLEMHLCDVDQGSLLPFIPEMKEFIVPQLTHKVKILVGFRNTVLNPKFNWRTIRLSAMYWRDWKKGDSLVKRDEKRKEVFRVCYSSHSSCSEILALLDLLQPRVVNLNVVEGRSDRRWEQLKSFKPKIPQKEEKIEIPVKSPEKFNFDVELPRGCDLSRQKLKEIRAISGEDLPLPPIPLRKKFKKDDE